MNKIDIVILWVNPEDANWKKEFEKYSGLENRETEGSLRYRDYGTLKYIFRGIEKNMSWVNKVHLILYSPSQIPSWMNTSCSKLEIHYHKEFIPINLIPTFNSNCIEMYLHNIKSLSEYYILFNDDQFVLNELQESLFVEYDKCVYQVEETPLRFNLEQSNIFKETLDNNLKFEINYCADNGLEVKKFRHHHLPEIHSKSNEWVVVGNYDKLFILSLVESRFRNKKNLTNWLFSDIIKLEKDCINKRIYENSKYVKLGDDFEKLRGCDLVCINDASDCSFDQRTAELQRFLEGIYPEKSAFEI